jgi:hypothetical protein
VRPFSRPCGDNSICAGDWPFRASQHSARAGKNQSVRPLFDLCGKKAGLWAILMITGVQKETDDTDLPDCEGSKVRRTGIFVETAA